MEKKSVFTLLILAILIATGYSSDVPLNSGNKFDVTNVKESKTGDSNVTTPSPNNTTTSTTVAPTTSSSTTTTIITTVPTHSTPTPITSTVTPQPVPSTTSLPPTTVAPPKPDRSFDLPSFVGGIILALGVLAIGYVVYKFYRARTDPNYRTL